MSESKIDGLKREIALAWAAGFIDGEGGFGVNIRRNKTRGVSGIAVYVQATQVDPIPLMRLKKLWGGSITYHERRNSKHADCYRWRGTATIVRQCVQEPLPYLTIKKPQAELALELVTRPRRPRKPGLSAQIARKIVNTGGYLPP